MKLKKEIIERVRGNKNVIPSLMDGLGKSRQTINRELRLNSNDGVLTTANSMFIISSILNVKITDLLEQ